MEHKRSWRARFVLVIAVALVLSAAIIGACTTPQPERITPLNPESQGATPGAAERASLGTRDVPHISAEPPDPRDAGLLTPEGDTVAAAINAEKARLAALDGGAPTSTSTSTSTNTKTQTETATSKEAGDVATLVFSSSVSGELVPCGCSPDLRGGLPRAASLLNEWRAKEPGLVFIEGGDLLFEGETAPKGPGAHQLELKARTLAKGAALLGAAARVVGARDLAAGGAFVAASANGLPLLDAGAEVPGARATLLVNAGPSGVPVGLFAAGLGKEPEKTIAARAAALHKEGARIVILLLHPRGDGALSSAQRLAQAAHAAGVDLIVLAHRDDPALDPNHAEESALPLLALEGHGQSLLRLALTIPPGAKVGAPLWMPKSASEKSDDLKSLEQREQLMRDRLANVELKPMIEAKIAELEARRKELAGASDAAAPAGAIVARADFRALSQELPDDAAAKALVAGYDKEVADENLAAAKKLPAECPRPKKGEAAFIGVSAPANGDGCAACHTSEAAFWARTRHARAYETLVAKGKQFSFDCIACHTTGWQQPGGVCRIDRTAAGGPGVPTPADRTGPGFDNPLPPMIALGRQGVQCEDCHGPGSEHARSGGERELTEEVAEATCKRCHDFANSPHFDFAAYRPWIVGPGHGAPLADGATPKTAGELTAGNKLGPNPALRSGAMEHK